MGGLGFGVAGELFEVVEEGFQLDSRGEMGGEGICFAGGEEGSFLLYLSQLIEAAEEEPLVGAAVTGKFLAATKRTGGA